MKYLTEVKHKIKEGVTVEVKSQEKWSPLLIANTLDNEVKACLQGLYGAGGVVTVLPSQLQLVLLL